jgi:hypothetical protein
MLSLANELAAIRMLPGFRETRQRLAARAQPKRRRWAWWSAGGLSIALAASLALVLTSRSEPRIRYKGRPRIELLREPDATGPVHAGEHVSLVMHAAGHPYALLMAIDEKGAVEQVWPAQGTQSGRLPPQHPDQPLEPGFEVTPGSFAVHAFLSDAPLNTTEAAEALHRAFVEGRDLSTATPAGWVPSEENARATLKVEVVPGH